MSGETEDNVSAFTTDSLHAHLRTLMDERDRRYGERFDASQKAVEKATAALERRLEGMNEIRAAMSEQAATFLPRTEYDTAHDALVTRVTELNDRMNRAEGSREGVRLSAGALVAILGVGLSLIVAVVAVLSYAAR